ncbi:MAG: hypothetical protein JKY96_06280 [Phycisphaerales bacterium]|nr:hypothetical protein [Phycisphaerales bacterium]
MSCFGKTVVRGTVIAVLAGGVLVAVAGPQRMGALMSQGQQSLTSMIDDHIDDPIILRAQIKKLEAEYPGKISDVRSDLSEVQTQIAQLNRELQVANKVVGLASMDLDVVDTQLAQARITQSANPGAIVRVSFDNRAVDLDKAYGKRQQIEQTRDLYASRGSDLETDLSYLNEQEIQLADLLERLTTEQSEFQAKLYQLDAQIDTIARNERLINMMEDRQATIDAHSNFQAHSLDQLNTRLSSIRNDQRARLEAIAGRDRDTNYVEEAQFLINQQGRVHSYDTQAAPVRGFTIDPQIIEIAPTPAKELSTKPESVASKQ